MGCNIDVNSMDVINVSVSLPGISEVTISGASMFVTGMAMADVAMKGTTKNAMMCDMTANYMAVNTVIVFVPGT